MDNQNNKNTQEEYMFLKPQSGWSYFNIFKYYNKDDCDYLYTNENFEDAESVFRVSYIDPIPDMLFNSLIDFFKNHKSAILTFDAEGYEWSLILNCYDNSVMILMPEGILNPFKKDDICAIDLSRNCFTAKKFGQDWCECYQYYRKEWNEFEYDGLGDRHFNENSHTSLDEKYDELVKLVSKNLYSKEYNNKWIEKE